MGFFYVNQVKSDEDYKKEVIEKEIKSSTILFNEWLDLKVKKSRSYINLIKLDIKKNVSIDEILNRIKKIDSEIVNVYFARKDGNVFISGGYEIKEKINFEKKQWYANTLMKDYFVTTPYKDYFTNKEIITISRAIYIDKELLGVVGIDIDLSNIGNKLFEILNELSLNYILINENNSLAITNNNVVNKTYILDHYINGEFIITDKYYILSENTVLKNVVLIIYAKKLKMIDFLSKNMLFSVSVYIIFVFLANKIFRQMKIESYNLSELLVNNDREKNSYKIQGIYKIIYDKVLEFYQILDRKQKEILNLEQKFKKKDVYFKDINLELKNLKAELATKKLELKKLKKIYVDNLDISRNILILDFDLKIIHVDSRLLKKLGYKKLEIVDNKISKILFKKNNCSIFRLRDYEKIDFDLIDKKGKKFTFRAYSRRIFISEDTKLIYLLLNDVTLEKKLMFEYEKKCEEFELINKIGFSFNRLESLNEILQEIVNKINLITDSFSCNIRLLESETLILKVYSGKMLFKDIIVEKNDSKIWNSLDEKNIIRITQFEDIENEKKLLFEFFEGEVKEIAYIPLYNKENLFGVMSFISFKEITDIEINIIKFLAKNASIEIEKEMIFSRLNNSYLRTIESLVMALEEKVGIFKGHTVRVSEYAVLIAKKLYLKKRDIDEIRIAALLHDIGKIGINDELLKIEYKDKELRNKIINEHTEIGRRIIEPIGLSSKILDGIYYHHIHYDLSGYPKEKDIIEQPLIARIIEAADQFDIMLTGMDNEFELTYKDVIRAMKKQVGTIYSIEVIDALENISYEEFESMGRIN